MANNISQFEADLDKAYQRKVVGQATEFFKAVALDAWQKITANSLKVGIAYGSPVLTGRYYNSHRISINGVDTSFEPADPARFDAEEPARGLPISIAAAALRPVKLGDTVYISNSVPYARKIEEGHSKFKAPEGVYEVSADAVRAKFKNAKITSYTKRPG